MHIYICIDVHESELSVPVACKSCSILNVCQRYAMVPGLARVTCWVIYMLMDRWESGFELAVLTEWTTALITSKAHIEWSISIVQTSGNGDAAADQSIFVELNGYERLYRARINPLLGPKTEIFINPSTFLNQYYSWCVLARASRWMRDALYSRIWWPDL